MMRAAHDLFCGLPLRASVPHAAIFSPRCATQMAPFLALGAIGGTHSTPGHTSRMPPTCKATALRKCFATDSRFRGTAFDEYILEIAPRPPNPLRAAHRRSRHAEFTPRGVCARRPPIARPGRADGAQRKIRLPGDVTGRAMMCRTVRSCRAARTPKTGNGETELTRLPASSSRRCSRSRE